MKNALFILSMLLLSGCSVYSYGQKSSDIKVGGFQVRCDATPPNQPGCYTPPAAESNASGHFSFGPNKD